MDAAGFAQRFITARVAKGWSQEALAEYSGIARRTIAGLEGQEYLGRLDTVVKLAETLGVHMSWLTWGEGPMWREGMDAPREHQT